ncbi:MAG: hypothetical protein K8T26_11000 [Lentisphaerae bacterium]|nr:hypothetical protein [Lentisphaerota bacterium]
MTMATPNGKTRLTIVELSNRAGLVFRSLCEEAGIRPGSDVHHALASGHDIAITLLETSTGIPFGTLTPISAKEIAEYFIHEAVRTEPVHREIAIYYRAWALVITEVYLQRTEL